MEQPVEEKFKKIDLLLSRLEKAIGTQLDDKDDIVIPSSKKIKKIASPKAIKKEKYSTAV